MNLIINQKFKDLLPPLSDDEFSQLEESVLSDGVRESIKVWQGQIVDGHNRHTICQKHDLPFTVSDMFFNDESEVLEWIYINQLGRRNLSDHQRKLYIGRLYNLQKKSVGAPEGNKNTAENNVVTVTTFQQPERTAEKIATEFKMSEKTVRTVGKLAEAIDENPELEAKFLSGEMTQKEILQEEKESENLDIGKIHGERILRKIRELSDAVTAADNAFSANGFSLSEYAPRIAKWKRNNLEKEARKLVKTEIKEKYVK